MGEKWGWDPTFGTPGTIECCKAEIRHYGGYEIDDIIAREMLEGIPQVSHRVFPHPCLKRSDS